MKKNILLFILLISFLLEFYLCISAFFNPESVMKLFRLPYNSNTALLAYFSAWFLLLISSICVYLMWLVQTNRAGYYGLINLLSLWWIGLGVAIFIMFKRTDNLLMDSLKGLLLLGANYLNGKMSVNGPVKQNNRASL